MPPLNWHRIRQAAFVLVVLGMLVAASRLNERGTRQAAIDAAIGRLRASQHSLAVAAYAQDVRSWQEKLSGCSRGKIDRRLEREGWASARRARLASAATGPAATINARAAAAYLLIVRSYGQRIEGLDCLHAFPVPLRPDGVAVSSSIAPSIARSRREDVAGAALERRISRASRGR